MSEQSQNVRQLFAKSCRLSYSKEFSYVFQKADKISDGYFLILLRKQDKVSPRLGLAVAKKNAKLAVQRNRIKRIIRESFRYKQSSMPAVDVVVMIRPQAATAKRDQLRNSIDKLWEKVLKKIEGKT